MARWPLLDNLALLFQTVSGLRVDLVAKFGGGTCYCFCCYLFLKIQQRADNSPTPPIHCAGQQLYSRPASAECAWRLVASTPAAQSQPGCRESWTMICRHDSWRLHYLPSRSQARLSPGLSNSIKRSACRCRYARQCSSSLFISISRPSLLTTVTHRSSVYTETDMPGGPIRA